MNVISLHVAKEMAFTGLPVTAARAERLGIINQAVPRQDLKQRTYDMAKQIAGHSPLSIAVMKEELNLLANAYDLSPVMFERIQSLAAWSTTAVTIRKVFAHFLKSGPPPLSENE